MSATRKYVPIEANLEFQNLDETFAVIFTCLENIAEKVGVPKPQRPTAAITSSLTLNNLNLNFDVLFSAQADIEKRLLAAETKLKEFTEFMEKIVKPTHARLQRKMELGESESETENQKKIDENEKTNQLRKMILKNP